MSENARPFNYRREPCPSCERLDCFVQGFAEQRFESWCLLCGFVQSWAEQVRVSSWRYGYPLKIQIELVEHHARPAVG